MIKGPTGQNCEKALLARPAHPKHLLLQSFLGSQPILPGFVEQPGDLHAVCSSPAFHQLCALLGAVRVWERHRARSGISWGTSTECPFVLISFLAPLLRSHFGLQIERSECKVRPGSPAALGVCLTQRGCVGGWASEPGRPVASHDHSAWQRPRCREAWQASLPWHVVPTRGFPRLSTVFCSVPSSWQVARLSAALLLQGDHIPLPQPRSLCDGSPGTPV